MDPRHNLCVDSEFGPLETVLLHRPGVEVENLDPENVEKALYSDILNLTVARREYDEFAALLSKVSETLEVRDLLKDILTPSGSRESILRFLIGAASQHGLDMERLLDTPPGLLADALIEGILLVRNTLTNFLSDETYSLQPLHNFLFVRDAAMVINDTVLTGKMANRVRAREGRIMHAVFRHHPRFGAAPIDPSEPTTEAMGVTIEGGDVLIAREDILIVGIGSRTTPQGIDFIVSRLASGKKSPIRHILVQELPRTPESFIHLDMVFTLLGPTHAMVYAPVILKNSKLRPIHVALADGKVTSIKEEHTLIDSLAVLGMTLTPILCGGRDERTQKREQWHSGANFFAVAPDKVIGYGRNEHTVEAMSRAGFEVLSARDVIAGKCRIQDHPKCVVTISGAELARGGGGCRCLTLPVKRTPMPR